MEYQALIIDQIRDENREIMIAELSALGFESFTENEQGLEAFIPLENYPGIEVSAYLEKKREELEFTFRLERISEQNWNAVWESQYQPVLIAGSCMIRAPFHLPLADLKYDLVIEPRMSFGTAHHETTSLMLEALLQETLKGKRLLDLGCGTGVLAILAWKMGANRVDAIDIDFWAYENAQDNVVKNNATGISVIHGDAGNIPRKDYHFILANINRNVLLRDMEVCSSSLAQEGILLLSGFYEEDLPLIREKAEEFNLRLDRSASKNHWVCTKFVK